MMRAEAKWSNLGLVFVALVVGGLSVGCRPKLPPNEKTYPVLGKVSMPDGGAAPKGAIVYFEPTGGGQVGKGPVASDGSYHASAYKGQDGLIPGEYKIRIGGYEPEGAATDFVGELAKIPEKYRKCDTSGLSYTVKAADNTYAIELK